MKPRRKPRKPQSPYTSVPERSKPVYELIGPAGHAYAQGRTPDQAKGVYLAAFPELSRNLDEVLVESVVEVPVLPYLVFYRNGQLPAVAVRFP